MFTILPSLGPFRGGRAPAASSPWTVRVIVGGVTRSASASFPRLSGPPKTTTDRAESAGPPSPEAVSSRATRRRTWMAAEWRRSASSVWLDIEMNIS